jgi:hypothetical protein
VFAILGVVALVAGVAWFVRGMTSSSGGASSPAAAVEQLASAVDAEDPAGIASALAPDEVRALGDVVKAAEKQARSSGLTPSDDAYAGVDVSVSDLELDVEELGPNTARVTIRRGEVAYDTEPEKMGSALGAAASDGSLSGGEISARSFEDDTGLDVGRDPFLIAVKRDGGWYVSLAYTAAEYLVRNDDRPDGDFDEEFEPEPVAEDPEEAVYSFAESFGRLEVEDAASSVSQPEWSVLHAYRDAIEDAIEREQAEGNLVDVDFRVDDADLQVEDLPDNAKKVLIDSAEGSYSWNDDGSEQTEDWEVHDGCLQLGEDDPSCLDNDSFLTRQLALETPFVVVVQESGGWVVSPMSTAIEYGKLLVPKLTVPTVLGLLGQPQYIEPTGQLDSGKTTEVELNEAGYATYTLTPNAANSFIIQYDELDEVDVFDERGEEVYGDYFADAQMYDLDVGTYTVVAHREDYDGGATGTINLNRLRVEDLPSNGEATGRVTRAQPIVDYRFRVPNAATRSIEVDGGGVVAAVLDETDEEICSFGYTCELSPGETYRLRIYASDAYSFDEASINFTARLSEESVTIDGSSTVSGFLEEGESAFHTVVVPSGRTATVYVTSSGDVDAYTDTDGDTDVGDAALTITGPFSGTLEVYMYSGPSDYEASIVED